MENINVDVINISKFAPGSNKQTNEELIYSKKTSKLDFIESGDNFLLYNIDEKYENVALFWKIPPILLSMKVKNWSFN